MKKILSVGIVIVMLFSFQFAVSADDNKNVVRVLVPEMLIYGESSAYNTFYGYDVVICDWMQYSQLVLTITYNKETLVPVYKNYPAVSGTVVPPVTENTGDGKRVFRVYPQQADDDGYPAKQDFDYQIYFTANAVGAHNLGIEIEAFDLENNRVELNIQTDNEIYPEILSAEEAGVTVLESLDLKNHYAYVHYYSKVADIKEKLKTDNFRIKNKKGEILDADDNISTDCTIEILYMDKVAFEKKICVPEDVNCDARVNAADARLALRAAAKLENLDTIQRYAADIDGKAGITAADARLILRKAAKLD